MALLNNPEARAKILDLYGQIKDVYEEERLRYQTMCCDLCGAKRCVSEVAGFEYHLAPKLCIPHGISWNSVYTRFSDRHTPVSYEFAKWLAAQVLKEARKSKGETHV